MHILRLIVSDGFTDFNSQRLLSLFFYLLFHSFSLHLQFIEMNIKHNSIGVLAEKLIFLHNARSLRVIINLNVSIRWYKFLFGQFHRTNAWYVTFHLIHQYLVDLDGKKPEIQWFNVMYARTWQWIPPTQIRSHIALHCRKKRNESYPNRILCVRWNRHHRKSFSYGNGSSSSSGSGWSNIFRVFSHCIRFTVCGFLFHFDMSQWNRFTSRT